MPCPCSVPGCRTAVAGECFRGIWPPLPGAGAGAGAQVHRPFQVPPLLVQATRPWGTQNGREPFLSAAEPTGEEAPAMPDAKENSVARPGTEPKARHGLQMAVLTRSLGISSDTPECSATSKGQLASETGLPQPRV